MPHTSWLADIQLQRRQKQWHCTRFKRRWQQIRCVGLLALAPVPSSFCDILCSVRRCHRHRLIFLLLFCLSRFRSLEAAMAARPQCSLSCRLQMAPSRFFRLSVLLWLLVPLNNAPLKLLLLVTPWKGDNCNGQETDWVIARIHSRAARPITGLWLGQKPPDVMP